jgi:hypothetical protein
MNSTRRASPRRAAAVGKPLRLWHPFTPPTEPDKPRTAHLIALGETLAAWMSADTTERQREIELRAQEMERKRRRLDRERRQCERAPEGKARALLWHVIEKHRDRLTPETIEAKHDVLKAAGIDPDALKDVASKAREWATQEQDLAAKAKECDAEQARHDTAAKHSRDLETGMAVVARLSDAIEEPGAAESLAFLAIFAASLLRCHVRKHPDMFKPVARTHLAWPVMATVTPADEWFQEALNDTTSIELAADVLASHGLKGKAWSRRHDPATAYAKRIIDTLEMNRVFLASLGKYWKHYEREDAANPGAFLLPPRWALDSLKLPPFSKASVKDWMRAARAMLTDEAPEFHTRPEWDAAPFNFTANAAKRVKPGGCINGRKRQDILDRIESRMESLALT